MPLHFSSVCRGSHLCGFLLSDQRSPWRFCALSFFLPTHDLSLAHALGKSCGAWKTLMAVTYHMFSVSCWAEFWLSGTVMHGILGNTYKSLLSRNFTPVISCSSSYLFRLMMSETVFQTEPVINEENEGIEQNTQMRSQGIIALSYRDWEVRPSRLPSAVLWLRLL